MLINKNIKNKLKDNFHKHNPLASGQARWTSLMFFPMFLGAITIARFMYTELNWSIDAVSIFIPFRCPIKFFLGLSCPTCGLGRAMIASMVGDYPQSFEFHPLGPIVYGGILLGSIFIFLNDISKLFPKNTKSK